MFSLYFPSRLCSKYRAYEYLTKAMVSRGPEGSLDRNLPKDPAKCKTNPGRALDADSLALHDPAQADHQDGLEMSHHRATDWPSMGDNVELAYVDQSGTKPAL